MTALRGSGVVVSKVRLNSALQEHILRDSFLPLCFDRASKHSKPREIQIALTVAADTNPHYNSVENEHTHD